MGIIAKERPMILNLAIISAKILIILFKKLWMMGMVNIKL